MTGTTWLALYPTSILALGDLSTSIRSAVIAEAKAARIGVYGADGTIGGLTCSWTYTAGRISVDLQFKGLTGNGDGITTDPGLPGWAALPFANVGGVAYEVGARVNFYPSGVSTNSIDGLPVYTEATEGVGEAGAPSAVVNTGTGLRFTVTSLAGTVWTTGNTRPVKVWKVTPSSGVLATAVVDGVAAYNGAGGITVTITGYLGQSGAGVSLNPADYQVMILGATIGAPGSIVGSAAYWFMGTVTTGVFSNVSARAFIPWGSWLSTFAVEHNTGTGKHGTVNADSFNFNPATAGRNGTFQVSAYELAAYGLGFRQNGGANQAGLFTAAGAAEPANFRTTGGISGTFAEILIPLRFPPDQAIVLNSLSAVVWLVTAGASEYFTIELIECPAAGFSGVIAVRGSWTMGKPAASTWGTVTPTAGPAFPFTLVAPPAANVIRYWRVRWYEPNPGNVRFAGFYGGAAAAKLSPLPH